jgi:MFS family permease
VYRLARASSRPETAPLALGIVGFVGQIPLFVLAPFAGVWVDRWNRRKLLVVTQTLAMFQSFTLAYLAFTHITIAMVVVLAFVQGLINAFDIPGRQTFLVEIVDREDLANAIAMNSTMVHGARLFGPALAGLLIPLGSARAGASCSTASATSASSRPLLLDRART